MKRTLPSMPILLLCALLVAVATGGCSPGGTELARVGSAVITVGDFEAAAQLSGQAYAGLGDSRDSLFLDDLIKRQLLIEAAKQRGYYKDTLFLDYARHTREQLLRSALVREITGNPKVSEGEIRALYDRQAVEAHCRLVFVLSEAAAREARKKADSGMDFRLVCAQFNTTGQIPPGGDIGWMKPGALVPVLDDALTDAPVGSVVGPVEQPGVGWFVMRIEERRNVERPPLDQAREQVSASILQHKRNAILQRLAARLMESYRVQLAPGAAQTMATKLLPSADDSSIAPQSPKLTEGEQGIVLARWDGGNYTLGEAQVAIQSGTAPPNLSMTPLVQHWIENQVLERALIQEAESRRLADDPENARLLRERENNYLLEKLYTDEVVTAISVTDDDLRQEFTRRAGQLAHALSASLMATMIGDSAAAIRVLDHGAHGVTLQQAVQMAGVQAPVMPVSVTYPSQQALWQMLEARVSAMRPGEMSGPFRLPSGWLVIQLTQKSEGAGSFEQITPEIRGQLQSAVIERKREARFVALTDSLRHVIPVVRNGKALARVHWPEFAPPGVGSGG